MQPAATGIDAGRAEQPHAPARRPAYSLLRRQGPWRDALRRRMLALADVLAFVAATALAVAVQGTGALWTLALLPVVIILAKGHGLYDQDHMRIRHLTIDESGRLFYWATLSISAVALEFALLPAESLDAVTALAMWGTMLGSAFVLRAWARLL